MTNERLLVPVDAPYVEALGRATYVFATLEWNAVWCCERMEADYIRRMTKKHTAGKIAVDLVRLASARPNPPGPTAYSGPAREFKRLVDTRNDIMHGQPGTAPSGEQRLFRHGVQWTLGMIDDAADEFAACSRSLNALLYGLLK